LRSPYLLSFSFFSCLPSKYILSEIQANYFCNKCATIKNKASPSINLRKSKKNCSLSEHRLFIFEQLVYNKKEIKRWKRSDECSVQVEGTYLAALSSRYADYL
jgi:hypothetical protein